MKILVYGESIAENTGGGRTGILGFCQALISVGNSVKLVTTSMGESSSIFKDSIVNASVNGVNIFYFRPLIVFFSNNFSIKLFKWLVEEVKASDLILIHSIYKINGTFIAFLCRFYGVPYILRPHGSFDPYLLKRRRYFFKFIYIHLIESISFHHASAIQYSCINEYKDTKKVLPDISDPLIISEGIDTSIYSDGAKGNFRCKYDFLENKTIILFLGRFHQKKGIELLITAFSSLLNKNKNIYLVLAGSGDDAYLLSLKNMINDFGISDYVMFTGQISEKDKVSLLYDSDIFVLPSYGENFGLSVVEALACSLPVIISNKVGISTEIKNNLAGLIIECDATELEVSLNTLIDDSYLRSLLGANGKKLVTNKFNLESVAHDIDIKYKKIFHKIIL